MCVCVCLCSLRTLWIRPHSSPDWLFRSTHPTWRLASFPLPKSSNWNRRSYSALGLLCAMHSIGDNYYDDHDVCANFYVCSKTRLTPAPHSSKHLFSTIAVWHSTLWTASSLSLCRLDSTGLIDQVHSIADCSSKKRNRSVGSMNGTTLVRMSTRRHLH